MDEAAPCWPLSDYLILPGSAVMLLLPREAGNLSVTQPFCLVLPWGDSESFWTTRQGHVVELPSSDRFSPCAQASATSTLSCPGTARPTSPSSASCPSRLRGAGRPGGRGRGSGHPIPVCEEAKGHLSHREALQVLIGPHGEQRRAAKGHLPQDGKTPSPT